MAKKRRPPAPAKFKVGDRVRVKRGIRDIDYPDMPLGGCAGTVTEVRGSDTFTIRWGQETREAIHPVFKKRCEIDGLDHEQYTLTGDDLWSLTLAARSTSSIQRRSRRRRCPKKIRTTG